MVPKYSKLWLVLVLAILFIPSVSALTLTLNYPLNITYTSSSAIPLDFTAIGNNETCTYKLNSIEYNLPTCKNTPFSVDYDGSYLLELYAYNTTDIINKNITFSVDRTSEFEQGKPLLAGIIIIVFVCLAFFCVLISSKFDESVPVLKTILIFIGIIAFVTAVYLSIVAVNEYLKFPSFEKFISIFGNVIAILLVFVAIYFIIVFITNIYKPLMERKH
jgi:hypothetical protein